MVGEEEGKHNLNGKQAKPNSNCLIEFKFKKKTKFNFKQLRFSKRKMLAMLILFLVFF